MRGEFLKSAKDQILGLIRNQEARAMDVNPLERIMEIRDQKDTMEIHTTTERFAQRLGREIQRAYKGVVVYHWSKDNKLARVSWER